MRAGVEHGSQRLRLRRGTQLELLMPPPHLEGRPWAMLGDGRVVWVPAGALEAEPEEAVATPAELRDLPGAVVDEDPYCLAPGIRHRRIRWRNARLHLIDLLFDENESLRPALVTADFFRPGQTDPEARRGFPVPTYSARYGALLAMNGTFFSTGKGNWGTPLGPLVSRGRVLNDGGEPAALLRRRSYLAWTSRGRFVTGELEDPASEVLRLNRQDLFHRSVLVEGERIVGLLGGLGRLARGGDPEAWRDVFRRQFPPSYYSRRTRRAQMILGVSQRGRRLHILAQEGAPRGHHRLTLPELGHMLVGFGAEDVLFADGGRSADLVLLERGLMPNEGGKRKRPVSTALLFRELTGRAE